MLRIRQAWLRVGLVHGSPAGSFLLGLACFLVLLCSGVVSISTRFTSPDTSHINTSGQTVFKWTVSRDEYFVEGLNVLISTLSVCADGFQCLSKAFHYPIQILTFYLPLLLLLLNYRTYLVLQCLLKPSTEFPSF
jgi:hypothetical protein